MARNKKPKIDKTKFDYLIYTDGGCAENPGGPGGYAAIVIKQDVLEIEKFSGGFASTTNNRMEIMAAIVGLNSIPEGSTYLLYSDSQYMLNCFSGLWARKKNEDLFELLDKAAKGKFGKTEWIRGHTGDTYNEWCDRMCQEAMAKENLPVDKGYRRLQAVESTDAKRSGKSGEPDSGSPSLDGLRAAFDVCSADDYVKKYMVNKVCADGILRFAKSEKHSFRDYGALKTGGLDVWSSMKRKELLKNTGCESQILYALETFFENDREVDAALRWYCRGLPVLTCIMKVQVDAEIKKRANEQEKS